MAFNSNELGVIRTYVAITGEAPTQAELQAAFSKTGLNALATDLINDRPAQGNTAFVTDLYENLLGRAPDAEGLEYWTSLLSSSAGANQLSKARLAVEFQNVAALNQESEADFVDGTVGLTPVNGEFADGSVEEPENPDPVEITTEFNFDTTKGQSDVAGWTHQTGDDTANDSQNEKTYMSNTNKIFNVGMEAIDEGVATISRDYTFRTENQLGEQGFYEAYFLSPVLDNVTTNLGSVLNLEVIDRMAAANDKDAALSLVAIESFSFRLNGEQIEVGSQAILNAETYEELAAAIEARIEELAAENPALANIAVSLGSDFTRQQVDADTLETTGANVLGTQIVLTATGNNLIERGGFSFGERSGVDRNVDPSGRQDTTVLGSETDLITTNLEFKNVGYGSQGGSVNVSGQSQSDKGVEQFDVVAEQHNLGLGVWLTSLSSTPLKDRSLNTLEVINLTGAADYFHVGTEQSAALSDNGGAVLAGKDNAGLTDVRAFNAAQFNQNVRINAEVTSDVIARDLNLVDSQGNPAGDNVVYSYNLGGGDNDLYLSFSQEVIAHEDAALSITTGSGSDKIHLVFDNDDAEPGNWQVNQRDLKNAVVNTGAGDDVIWTEGAGDVTILAGSGNDTIYTDNSGSQFDAVGYNLGLTFGAGNDNALAQALGLELVDTTGDGNADSIAGQVNAHWVYNANNLEVLDLDGNALSQVFLPKAKLTVTFDASAITGNDTATSNILADAGVVGFESTVDVPTGNGFVADQRHINQAIKDAINNNATLNKLLVAEDGPDNTLIIRSLIDGAFTADSLSFDFALAEVTAADNDIVAAYKDFANDSTAVFGDVNGAIAGQTIPGSAGAIGAAAGGEFTSSETPALGQVTGNGGATDITGSIGTESTNNVIDAGAGQDVIVLSTTEVGALTPADPLNNSNELLVFTGNFGKNTIVNFNDGAAGANDTTPGADALNFTAYLSGKEYNAASSSAESQIHTAIAHQATLTNLGSNEVGVVSFDATADANQTFAGLNASNLLAAINTSSSFGGITDAAVDADNAAANFGGGTAGNIVGTSFNSLLFVENDLNRGEYKVFELTANADTGSNLTDFASASLVGTVDFGESIDFTTVNLDNTMFG